MIRNFTEYRRVLKRDFERYPSFKANGFSVRFRLDSRRKLLIFLRRAEYFDYQVKCKKKTCLKLLLVFYLFRLKEFGEKIGVEIKKNSFGPGLYITHIGGIVINGNSRIGENCTINAGVNIGNSGKVENVPILGDNIWIGPGAKIFGRVMLANGIAIGANAVVNKTFSEENITIAGVPAKKVSGKGSRYQI